MAPLLDEVRRASRVSITDWARRAGTSRPTLSAYLSGRVDPRLSTTERLLHAVGLELTTRPAIERTTRQVSDGSTIEVLDHLPRLPVAVAFTRLEIPALLTRQSRRVFNLRDDATRAECFGVLLTASRVHPDAIDIIATSVDAAALMTVWHRLTIDPLLKEAWEPSLHAS